MSSTQRRLHTNYSNEDFQLASSSNAVFEHFRSIGPLSSAELKVLQELVADARYHPPHRDIFISYHRPLPPRLLCSGWACRYYTLSNGRRQIVAILLPGDFIGMVLEPYIPSICAIAPLTEVEVASAKPLTDAARCDDPVYPTLARATQLSMYSQDILLCEHAARLGQRSALERFAHLMLELYYRLSRLGLVDGESFPLPLTQNILADALGLSVVHINRIMKQLRQEGMFSMTNGKAKLLHTDQMRQIAGWTAPCLLLDGFRQ